VPGREVTCLKPLACSAGSALMEARR
jgi:hypothetical protein